MNENKVLPHHNHDHEMPPDIFPGKDNLPNFGNFFYIVNNTIYLRGWFTTMPSYWQNFTISEQCCHDEIRNALRSRYKSNFWIMGRSIWLIEFPNYDTLIKFILEWS